ncbi:dihydrouridine(20/20a) synthase [Seminavis robusta]|uniref:Dihydrouridine(20/20a) synthase n=1 Tax=Seminavis robusta TaxID=568900 RepID=A0A9N8EVP2_9STRA|nr:dihydrouridine(20/20a) synthase [Seminavis robusta]|eukprot:Sro1697_g291920.1 dihydrouridine(20/20a) synthase (474) ;mRNA; r:15151-16572
MTILFDHSSDDGTRSCHSTKELHVAPMVNYSNREFRALLRILSRRLVLWTEMLADNTLLHTSAAKRDDLLLQDDDNNSNRNVIVQIGSNSPERAAQCVAILLQHEHYYLYIKEINLNCECPSSTVAEKNQFGAALMKSPTRMADIVAAMQSAALAHHLDIDVSIKMRIGVDDQDDWEFVANLIGLLVERGGCTRFILHARKVYLQGLNARQNRTKPPLNYQRVFRLCHQFPNCHFWLNGGIATLEQAKELAYGYTNTCSHHDTTCQEDALTAPLPVAPPNLRGVMMGRAALDNVALFGDVDRYFYGAPSNPCHNRADVLEQYCLYLERTYPRRCCDNNSCKTLRYPAPVIHFTAPFCPVCQVLYGTTILTSLMQDDNDDDENTAPTTTQQSHHDRAAGTNNKDKISSRLIGNALKPVQSLFAGLPCHKAFRRASSVLVVQDATIRNCGPGFVLRMAVRQSVPREYLVQPLVVP